MFLESSGEDPNWPDPAGARRFIMPAKDPDFPLALPEQAGATSTPVVAKRPEKDV